MTERVAIIVQARMGSTRLPGKVLADLTGAPMLQRILERLQRCAEADDLVVATTTNPIDDPIVVLIGTLPDVGVVRGSENDVLARYHQAARAFGADIVVRVTADCPLIEPTVVDRCIRILRADPTLDYASNTRHRTYPRGLDVEAIRSSALAKAHHEATTSSDREHVTPFIWRQPQRFRLAGLTDAADNSDLRWTVDAPEDLELVRRIYASLLPSRPQFSYSDALQYVRSHPLLADINRRVAQKPI